MSELTPDKSIQCDLMSGLLLTGLSIEQVVDLALTNTNDRSVKSKKRKQLMELYNLHLKDTKEGEVSISLNDFFDAIGWSA